MSELSARSTLQDKQSDMMLWIAGGAIAVIGLVWLLLSHPWSAAGSAPPAADVEVPSAPAVASEAPAADDDDGSSVGQVQLDNPLRMAELAYQAGMLIEPQDYSAWTLYKQVLDREPDNEAAKQGLAKVAGDLLERANVALEQGRYEDARDIGQRILAVLPKDAAAQSLLKKVQANQPKPEPKPAPRVAKSSPTPAPTPKRETPKPVAPPVVEKAPPAPAAELLAARDSFRDAMSNNRLLTPADSSAKHYVGVLEKLAPDNDITHSAQRVLFDELLSRSRQALEALDTDAARTWIDEAEQLGVDSAAVAQARDALADGLIAMESQRPLPASELKVTSYTAPEYPSRAQNRGTEGWVDLEFTVTADGQTRDVTVSDSSGDSSFRDASVKAVSQWRFEPRVFMDRKIDQRVFTRIRFTLAGG